MSFTLVWVHLGCYNKTPRLGRLWTTKIYFWQFWRLRFQVQGVIMAGFLAKALLQDADCWLLPVSSHGRRRDLALWGFIFKGTNPSCEGSSPKLLHNITLDVKILTRILGGHKHSDCITPIVGLSQKYLCLHSQRKIGNNLPKMA